MTTRDRPGGITGQIIHFPRFDVHRINDTAIAGVRLYSFPVRPEEAAVVHPDNENLIRQLDINYVPQGTWRADTLLHPQGGHDMAAGDGLYLWRYKSRYRFTAQDSQNGWICIKPKDGVFWLRSLVNLAAAETITLDTSPQDQYVFVVSGLLSSDAPGEHLKNEMICVPAGTVPRFTAIDKSVLIRLYSP